MSIPGSAPPDAGLASRWTVTRGGGSDAIYPASEWVTGGSPIDGPGYFWQPTLLTDVTPEMRIYREETFGPVAPVTVFDDDDAAVAMANDTSYGLASYVYTRDLSRAIRTAEALRFGMVGINDINPTSAAVPFGGTKDSGLGREGARQGLDEYLDTKVCGIAL